QGRRHQPGAAQRGITTGRHADLLRSLMARYVAARNRWGYLRGYFRRPSPETQPLWNGVRPATFLLQDHASKEEVRTCAITAFTRLRRARRRSATSSSPATSRTLSRTASRPWANPRWRFVSFPAPNWRSKPRRGRIGCRLCSSTGAGGPSVTTSAYSG